MSVTQCVTAEEQTETPTEAKFDSKALSKLRPRHQRFLNEWLKNGRNGTQAYLAISPKTTKNAAAVQAYQLLRRPHIKAAIEKFLQQDCQITRESVQAKLLWACQEAEKAKDYSATAAIAMDQAKLAGFLVEKREVKTVADEEKESIRKVVRDLVSVGGETTLS